MGDKVILSFKALYRLLEDAYNNGFNQKAEYDRSKSSASDICLQCKHRTKKGGNDNCKTCELANRFMQKD